MPNEETFSGRTDWESQTSGSDFEILPNPGEQAGYKGPALILLASSSPSGEDTPTSGRVLVSHRITSLNASSARMEEKKIAELESMLANPVIIIATVSECRWPCLGTDAMRVGSPKSMIRDGRTLDVLARWWIGRKSSDTLC